MLFETFLECRFFSKNHLECILEKFFEAFGLFQTFMSVEFEKIHDYTFEKKNSKVVWLFRTFPEV